MLLIMLVDEMAKAAELKSEKELKVYNPIHLNKDFVL